MNDSEHDDRIDDAIEIMYKMQKDIEKEYPKEGEVLISAMDILQFFKKEETK